VAALALAVTAAGGERTAWFHEARTGVFIHYLAPAGMSVREWNQRVDGFDVEGLARQLERVHAGYLILTLGQNSGHYLSPNRAYDRLVGITPSHCSRRDLIADLHKALAPRGIRMMVYLPAGAPDQDPVAMLRLDWRRGPERLREFQQKWEQVIAEWSRRWGKSVSGWWFDGCYWPDAMYRTTDTPNFFSFAAAARAGNPASIVAFNPGVKYPILAVTPAEDYTAGEIDKPEKVEAPGRTIGGEQTHMLSYIGKWWSGAPVRFTPEQVADMTGRFVARGGVVSWDVPTSPQGLIPEEFLVRLEAAAKAARAARRK
jgi:hypothetical protein